MTAKLSYDLPMHDLLFQMDWVPELRSDALTQVFKVVTVLGSSWFGFLFLALGLLFWRKGPFLRLIIVCAFSEILNTHLKAATMAPRPDPSFHLVDVGGLSFPSGHAQHGTVMWLWLAWELGRPQAWVGGVFLALSIALSRVYLGVHFGRDIVAGAAAGAVMLFYFRWLFTTRRTVPERQGYLVQLTLVTFLQLMWTALAPGGRPGSIFLPTIIFIGFLVGAGLERKMPASKTSLLWLGIGATIIVFGQGLFTEFGGAASWRGPLGLGTQPVAVTIQFALLGIWMGWIAPIVFKKLEIPGWIPSSPSPPSPSTVDGVDR